MPYPLEKNAAISLGSKATSRIDASGCFSQNLRRMAVDTHAEDIKGHVRPMMHFGRIGKSSGRIFWEHAESIKEGVGNIWGATWAGLNV